MDAILNFSIVEVSTGYDDAALTVVLASGEGAKLPQPSTDGAFNLTWWDESLYGNPAIDAKVEIVRCTARTSDTLTIARAQEATSASTKNTSASTYKMILTPTKKTITDIYGAIDDVTGVSMVANEVPTGLINDSNKIYTTAETFADDSTKVYLNRTRLVLDEDYVETDSETITLTVAPATGDDLTIDYVRNDAVLVGGVSTRVANETPTGDVDGSNKAYDTANTFILLSIEVFLNGQLQTLTTDYAETDNNTITFVTAPMTGDIVRVSYQKALSASGDADTLDGASLSTDGTLAGDSDTDIPTEKAVKTYVDTEIGDAWASWTPTYANLTVGNGTVVAKYNQIGKTITCRLRVKLGSTSAMTGALVVSLPVTSVDYTGASGCHQYLGIAAFLDSETLQINGLAMADSTTTIQLRVQNSSSTYGAVTTISSTIPWTWAENDEFSATFTYEAA